MVRNNLAFAAVVLITTTASAGPIEVGQGDHHAYVVIEFKDEAIYVFGVSFDGSPSGMGLLDVVEAETTLQTTRIYDGAFIDGISYAGHSNQGYGGGEDWWHYWVNDSGQPDWTSPQTYGAADRVVGDGDMDGWVYGRTGAPRIPGDANLDNRVSIADLAVMAGNYGEPAGMEWSDADFTGDGAVTIGDLAVLAGYYGFGVSGSSLPEPATIVLTLTGAGIVLLRRRAGR